MVNLSSLMSNPRHNNKQKGVKAKGLPFRWRYIILPIAILILSIILSAYFYHLLPAKVAYSFKPEATPSMWFSRGISMVWALLPQFFFTVLAAAIVWGATKSGILSRQTQDSWIKLERILSLMGNMTALPQLIIFFAMLDIFSYNSYQIHVMPMQIVLFTILGLATIALMLFLALIVQKARQQVSQPKD